MTTITTYTGLSLDILDEQGTQNICLEDIAHALACTNRYMGHAPRPYSVAQHSVLCAQHVGTDHQLQALFHDAHEAYVGDMSSMVKPLLPDFQRLEATMQRRVFAAFRIPLPLAKEVHEVDRRMLVTEARAFGFAWWNRLGTDPISGVQVEPWHWHKAKQRWLSKARLLLGMN